ncbi:MAG: hypothetical protein KF788_08750 [Piscinibacter sp.]|nr:hypothetical protein [Piscinibacter sp.]
MWQRTEVRDALARAAEELWERTQGTGATWRDMAVHACVGFGAARDTAKNMAVAGELQVVGQRSVPGVCRPMRLYAPRRRGFVQGGGAALDQALRGWVRG